jgi:membrane dipeptidase
MLIVDAHEDIAWNMLAFGRDYTRSVAQTRADEVDTPIPGRVGQAMLGWPDWLHGQVGVIFATLYACPSRRAGKYSSLSYATAEQAHQLYQRQLRLYHDLIDRQSDKFYLITCRANLAAGLEQWSAAPPARRRIGLVLLMEGADGVSQPAELPRWFDQGLRVIGPAWNGTRYAGGTGEPGPFTGLGKELLARMAELGMILDLSHLTDEGVDEALAHYPGPIIASHSNARALLPHNTPERHLSNQAIRRLAERQGVIGVVLPQDFVKDKVKLGSPRQLATLDDVVDHIDYMSQLVGHCRHLGVGSDLDGGFGLEHSPEGLDSIADLPRLAEALDRRGYSGADIEAILGGNWLNFLRRALPEA